jgi:putative endopeptidase
MLVKNRLFACAALATTLAIGCALSDPSAGQPAGAPEFGTWGFDASGIDRKAKPGDSFDEYANGAWDERTVIPPDKVRFGMFDALRDRSEEQLRAIVEDAAKEIAMAGPSSDPNLRKIGGIYNAFMDVARIEQLDATPIADDLAKIRDAKSKDDIAVLMGRARAAFGASFFYLGVYEDQKAPTRNALYSGQAGLGLPDRDYYLREPFKDKKAKYRDYVARMLDMVGWPAAQKSADDIVALETRIAEASWSRAESREQDKTYNPRTTAELAAFAPGFPWSMWLGAAQVEQADRIIVAQLSAFPKLATIFADTPLETLQAWQAFHVVDGAAPFLSKRFVEARFEFRNKELAGQPEDRPRWKRGVQLVDGSLGFLLGKEYVARHFPPQSKAKMDELVGLLRTALQGRIERLTWMTPQTKAKALEKLSLFSVKIGYPNKWRNYASLQIDPTDLVGNIRRSGAYKWARSVRKLSKPVDPEEWGMTPQTVNAYYSSTRNEIVFPAGILQAPFFDPNADMAINYGGIGGVIGHEMTHGFDDQGRKSDGHGVLTDWWTPADAAAFQAQADKYGAQFDSYSVAPGVNVNGKLTMGENIADLGGLLLAIDGYQASRRGEPDKVLDGFTGVQRVFLGWAQVWRGKSRPDALIQQVTTDPHSPPRFRIDGPMRNIDAWYDAWGVKPGDKLYLKPDDRVRIW